jgi:hypothetical protein
MTNYVKNILAIYAQADQFEMAHGLNWYTDAKAAAFEIADKYEMPLSIVVGVIAALSPTNKWERNIVDAENLIECFINGGYMEDINVCTYKTMKEKAWNIMVENNPLVDHIAKLLNGPKITDFFWCILGHDVCVIDGHAWCIANADRRTLQEVPNIGKKLRQELQAAYSAAGASQGVTAYEMQAITWVAWKRIYNV